MSAARVVERPGPTVHLEAMRRRHLRAVMRIEAQVYPRPWSLSLFLSELAVRGSRSYTVARISGEVVGYSGLMLAAGEGHITTVAVDPAWHRHQIGTRLMLDIAHVALHHGVSELTLEVRVSNHAAQALYRRFGFAPEGIRANYYSETNEDAIVMWAHDIGTREYAERLAREAARLNGSTVVPGGRW